MKDSNGGFFHFFSFTQNRKLGDIYFSLPNSTSVNWVGYEERETGPFLVQSRLKREGKLSAHKSGRLSVREHDDSQSHKGIIWGSHLLNVEKKELGARHLLTAYPKKPTRLLGVLRKSDYVIESNTSSLEVFSMLFFAIPRMSIKLSFEINFHMDDLVTVPPIKGFGLFPLVHHDIIWCMYTTKGMVKWPQVTQATYSNGYTVPLFFPQENKMRLECRNPKYFLEDNNFMVQI